MLKEFKQREESAKNLNVLVVRTGDALYVDVKQSVIRLLTCGFHGWRRL